MKNRTSSTRHVSEMEEDIFMSCEVTGFVVVLCYHRGKLCSSS